MAFHVSPPFLGMGLAVSGSCCFAFSLFLVEFLLLLVLLGNGLALESHAYAVKGIALVLHDMKAVYDNRCIGKTCVTMEYMESE